MASRNSPLLAIPLSLLAAIVLTALPLPPTLSYWRPDWVALVLVFWVLKEPGWVGVWTAFMLGLVVDVETVSLFGLHPFMLAVIAYLTRVSSRWVGVFSIWQTAALVFVLLVIELLVKFVVLSAQGAMPTVSLFGLPALTSAMIWPFVALALRRWSVAIR